MINEQQGKYRVNKVKMKGWRMSVAQCMLGYFPASCDKKILKKMDEWIFKI